MWKNWSGRGFHRFSSPHCASASRPERQHLRAATSVRQRGAVRRLRASIRGLERGMRGATSTNRVRVWTRCPTTKTCSPAERRPLAGRLGKAFPAWASAEPASRLRKSHPHRPPEPPPHANDPVPGQSRQQNRQKLALARLILRWQDTRKMNASENQFSLTRTAPSTSGRAKTKFLSV